MTDAQAATGPDPRPDTGQSAPGPLALSDDEVSVVAGEAAAAAAALDEPARTDASRLAEAARAGEVPPELLDVLADVAATSLRGGRARLLYRAEGERLLSRVLARTPRGRAIQSGIDDVNAALRALKGRELQEVRVVMRTPGSYTVALGTTGVSLTLALDPSGVTVESLST